MKLLDIFGLLKKDMDYIEKELYRSVRGEQKLLSETSLHLLKAGGKRLRPVFVLLGGKFGTYDIERLKLVAVPLELIHRHPSFMMMSLIMRRHAEANPR